MKDFHISQFHNKFGLDSNLIFWITIIKESQKIIRFNPNKKVLDFGCGNGKFLHLYDLMDEFSEGYGIDLNEELIKKAKEDNINKKIKYDLSNDKFFEDKKDYFDVIYSQEVIYTIKDLNSHAKTIFDSLKKGGFYFATIGNHIQNSLWAKRREIIKKDFYDNKINYYPYDYSLDEVANIFYNAGFEVGLKRLPLEYFMIYEPIITKEFSNSLYDLVKVTTEYKMLFMFYKPIIVEVSTWSDGNVNKQTGNGYGIYLSKESLNILTQYKFDMINIIVDNEKVSHELNNKYSQEIRGKIFGKFFIKNNMLEWEKGKPYKLYLKNIYGNIFTLKIKYDRYNRN